MKPNDLHLWPDLGKLCEPALDGVLLTLSLGVSKLSGASSDRVFGDKKEIKTVSKLIVFIIAFLVLLLAGAAVYLMTADIPAPSAPVTKTLNNDRFPS